MTKAKGYVGLASTMCGNLCGAIFYFDLNPITGGEGSI